MEKSIKTRDSGSETLHPDVNPPAGSALHLRTGAFGCERVRCRGKTVRGATTRSQIDSVRRDLSIYGVGTSTSWPRELLGFEPTAPHCRLSIREPSPSVEGKTVFRGSSEEHIRAHGLVPLRL